MLSVEHTPLTDERESVNHFSSWHYLDPHHGLNKPVTGSKRCNENIFIDFHWLS